ncbi:hypothetical protein Hanom_Chr07g00664911 [Helianthus anomalus]
MVHIFSFMPVFFFFFFSKLQVLSFIYMSNYRWCPLAQNLTSYVLNVSKSCMLCPLSLTQLFFYFFC